MRRRVPLVACGLAAVAGVLVTARALRAVPSDEEQIRTLLRDAARAADEKRIDGVVHGLSERLEKEADGWRVTTAAWRAIPLEEALAGPAPGR